MDWLNYHHLLYFWTVAREQGVSRAATSLHVAHPTVSAQVRTLERSLGQRLFERQGRNLRLTIDAEKFFRYADEIFALGREICRRYKVAWVGELDRVRERFYSISVERRITHPAVRLIADQAKRRLFT